MNDLIRHFIHYGIHFALPPLIAWIWYRRSFKTAALILLAGILLDIDHLWANPIFDTGRCSIGYHTLHQWPFITLYVLLLGFKHTRIAGLAFLVHILADTADCTLMDL